ncbi:MAG: polysulfide reductase NrfD [Gammaproteobacteria bacterium]|nr:polysulfide reductase NrfD [Gammaproteobacteria bacterium]
MKEMLHYREIPGKSAGYYAVLAILGVLIALGLGAAYYMEHQGHHVTGMNNQIVWGMPHVFAVFLIVAASGALNVASISSVFNKKLYKPLAPLSGLVAIALLVGGLCILVLDLGRPDRLIVAMTYYNFKSIFAWNIFLYTGFIAIVAVYLWMMLERRFNKFSKPVGFFAFIWRLILTTGTGSIFGFLVARQAYDAAILAPVFIVMSFSFGLAVFNILLIGIYSGTRRPLGDAVVERLRKLQGVFIAAVLFFVTIFHLTSLYATERHGVMKFILDGGNVYTGLFWLGFVLIGSIIPLVFCLLNGFKNSARWLVTASVTVIAGGMAQMYVIIIGGQAYPLDMFPGYEVSSSFFDGDIGSYTPSIYEVGLGAGGFAFAIAIVLAGVKILRFLPLSLANSLVDPHYHSEERSEENETAAGEQARA